MLSSAGQVRDVWSRPEAARRLLKPRYFRRLLDKMKRDWLLDAKLLDICFVVSFSRAHDFLVPRPSDTSACSSGTRSAANAAGGGGAARSSPARGYARSGGIESAFLESGSPPRAGGSTSRGSSGCAGPGIPGVNTGSARGGPLRAGVG